MEPLEAEKLMQQLANKAENVWVPSPKLKYYDAGSEILDLILSDEKYYLARKEQELINLHRQSIMDFGDYSCNHTIQEKRYFLSWKKRWKIFRVSVMFLLTQRKLRSIFAIKISSKDFPNYLFFHILVLGKLL